MPQATLDYIIITFLLIGFVLGFKSGLVQKIFSFAGFILAILSAFIFSPKLQPILNKYLDLNPSTVVIVSFIVIFLLVMLITKIIIYLIKPKKSVLSLIDRFLGGTIGTLQMGLFLSGVLIFLSLFDFPDKEVKAKLHYYKFTYNLLPETISFIRKIYPESESIFQIFDELKARFDNGRDIR